MTACPSDLSEILPALSPLLLAAFFVSALASSQDSDTSGRFTAFAFTTVAHLGYTLIGDWSGLYSHKSIGDHIDPASDWLDSLLDVKIYIDIGVVALLAIHSFGASVLPEVGWKTVAAFSAFVHLIDIAQGGIIAASVFVAGVMATGGLNAIGRMFDNLLSFLPDMLRVSVPTTHQLLGLTFLILGPAVGHSMDFGDILSQPEVIASAVTLVAIYALQYAGGLETTVGQLVTASAIVAGIVATHHVSADITDAANTSVCTNGTALQMVAASLEPVDFPHVASVLGGMFSAAALAMVAAVHVDEHYDAAASVSRVTAVLVGKSHGGGGKGKATQAHDADCESSGRVTITVPTNGATPTNCGALP